MVMIEIQCRRRASPTPFFLIFVDVLKQKGWPDFSARRAISAPKFKNHPKWCHLGICYLIWTCETALEASSSKEFKSLARLKIS